MSDQLIFIGVIFIFFGILLIMVGSIFGAEKGKVEVGFGGFIGPIPFGWASNPRMLKWVILISVVAMVLFLILIVKNHSMMFNV